MELLNNPWFIGIGGGILSGIIVAFLSRYLFSKRDNKEYLQKVTAVNKEVIYALRPGISEGEIPSTEVFSSLISATARKYKVDKTDVFSPKQIAEDLIKEIMDSSFISAETKKSYCESLSHLIEVKTSKEKINEKVIELKLAEKDYRQKMILRMSYMLGITVAMMTMATVLVNFLSDPFRSPSSDIASVIFPFMAAVLALMVSMISAMVIVRLRRENKNIFSNSESKKSSKIEKDS